MTSRAGPSRVDAVMPAHGSTGRDPLTITPGKPRWDSEQSGRDAETATTTNCSRSRRSDADTVALTRARRDVVTVTGGATTLAALRTMLEEGASRATNVVTSE